MFRRQLLTAILAASCLLVSPAGASAGPPMLHAAAADHKAPATSRLPVIKSVKPLRLSIGDTLTIVGRNFLPGKGHDIVVFLRDGAPAVFLRAGTATKTTIKVTLTSKLGRYLTPRNNGDSAPTRFRLRVLARRFGASFTPHKLSPLVLPAASRRSGGGDDGGPSAPTCTLASAGAAPGSDADGDGLNNALELRIKTDPCIADSDGDAIPDGYEYESALDYNSRALPYPGKRPYPNPLDPSDADTDYDSDGLTMADEHAAWIMYGHSSFPLLYSDGTQTSGGNVAVTPATRWEDLNGDGFLTDDEKDVDGDGLTNWDEAHGRMVPEWWQAAYPSEVSYPLPYLQTDWLDPDTDGDTLPDGADDVDHDGYTNAQEILRDRIWFQPFNPCIPDPTSIVCARHPPFDSVFPPFAQPGGWTSGEPIPLRWPRS
jgi:hypothetical protein